MYGATQIWLVLLVNTASRARKAAAPLKSCGNAEGHLPLMLVGVLGHDDMARITANGDADGRLRYGSRERRGGG